MQTNCSIYLVRLNKTQNEIDGQNAFEIESIKPLQAERDIPGMQTFWQGQAQAIVLTRTFVIKARMYNAGYTVILSGDDLYEIVAPAKAKDPTDIKLNCKTLVDPELKNRIKSYGGFPLEFPILFKGG